jgi:hydrogenase maturation protein HypF
MAADDQTPPFAGVLCRRFRVCGVVQGVGFRPWVWRLATGLGLDGWVENDSSGVTIQVEGEEAAVAAFERALRGSPPPQARIEWIDVVTLAPRRSAADAGPRSAAGFTILDSHRQARGATSLPADIAPCAACLAEIHDPSNRRHRHPFANCIDCGPRFTVIRALPYDRATTTLATFPLCPDCAREYADPADRRFHAQPIACPACGPVVWFDAGPEAHAGRPAPAYGSSDDAIRAARASLRSGSILAVKGVGGFHLVCDATNPAAVALLRSRKHRPSKPLAVIVASAADCAAFASLSAAERRLLESPERPIVLLAKREDGAALAAGAPLAEAVAPGIAHVGVMLPAFPLHALLLDAADGRPMPALVMTSGNVADAPIEIDNAAAIAHLGPIVDGFLLHDRPIHVPCDDSVVRLAAGHLLPLRRSRGYAPLPLPLADDGPDLLAIGGELKATLCVARGRHAWMSQHVGDVTIPAALSTLERTARHLLALFAIRPAAIAADLHPGYLSTALARKFAAELGVPLLQIQHHQAHAAALLADRYATHREPLAGPALIAAFDGSGFCADGSIAGSEFFMCAGGDAAGGGAVSGLQPCARLAPFLLPGGEACIRHPWRTALALLHAAGIPWDAALPPVQAAGLAAPILRRQLDRRLATVITTSMGRLFDGVAAILGLRQSIDHEGEAAMSLEGLASDPLASPRIHSFTIHPLAGGTFCIGWEALLRGIVADLRAGVAPRDLAAGFHRAVAEMIVAVAGAVGDSQEGERPLAVGLTGGVFQNALLVEEAFACLTAASYEPFGHRIVPPNDGGIALGQILLGRAALARSRCPQAVKAGGID